MKILIDVNLSPGWVEELRAYGWEALHWTAVGDPRATDREIMQWALSHGYIVFTHDLDFGALLAATRAQGPSVIQVRAQDVMPSRLGNRVAQLLHEYESFLEKGALIIFDERRSRARILPLP